jgi:hypothetical protein
MDEAPYAEVVRMLQDYTTESGNLGSRTYQKNVAYQVDDVLLAELLAAGVAEKIDFVWTRQNAAIRRKDKVIPKVTRWFTANGIDTYQLTAGQPALVPSNLAVWLTLNGFAEAA